MPKLLVDCHEYIEQHILFCSKYYLFMYQVAAWSAVMFQVLIAVLLPLLIIVTVLLAPVIPAQHVYHPNPSLSNGPPNLMDKDSYNAETLWWYDQHPKYASSKYVLEYKGQSSSLQSVSKDSLRFLSLENMNSSIVVQYYSSNKVDCGDACSDMIERYIQLAIRVHDLTTSNPADRGPLVTFHAINCAKHAELCQMHQVTMYPTFRLEKLPTAGQRSGVLDIPIHHLHPYELIEKLGLTESEIPDEEHAAMSQDSTEVESRDSSLTNNFPSPAYTHRSRIVLLNDIHLALDHSLRSVVFGKSSQHPSVPKYHNEFTVTERDVLKSFLLLLQKTLPTTATHIQGMVHAVIDGFMYATKHHAYMIMLLDQHPPVREKYSEQACATESYNDNYRVNPADSYRCVMWDLLHMMSVGMVDYNRQSYDGTEMLHPATSLHTIFEYVQLFGFTTSDDASSAMPQTDLHQKEFAKLYRDCSFFDRCNTLPEAPKFIYENERDQVSKEIVARITTTLQEWKMVPLYISALRNAVANLQLSSLGNWPSKETCSVCWERASVGPNGNTSMKHDTLNLQKFLKVEYGHFDTLTESYRKELEIVATLKQDEAISDTSSVDEITRQIDIKKNKQEQHKEKAPFSHKKPPNQRDHNPIIPPVRHGSLFAILLIGVVVRWFVFEKRQEKQPESSKESARTIQHTFENESVDYPYSSPKRRFQLSPTKRNRRVLEKQEAEPRPVTSFIPLESLEEAVDHSSTDEHAPPEIFVHSSPRPSIASPKNMDSPAGTSSPNGLSVSLSSQLRRRLPNLPITNS